MKFLVQFHIFSSSRKHTENMYVLRDVIISEHDAYIAFAGKRIFEQTLNKKVHEGSQAAGVFIKHISYHAYPSFETPIIIPIIFQSYGAILPG